MANARRYGADGIHYKTEDHNGRLTAASSLDSKDMYALTVWNDVGQERTTIRLSRQEAEELQWNLRQALADGRDIAPA